MTTYAFGDPQASLDQLLAVLTAAGVVDRDQVRSGAAVLSMGDHFDFKAPEGRDQAWVSDQGLAILEWLLQQPPSQASILMGNHDVCRVMELAHLGDAEFARAKTVDASSFAAAFPDIPTRDIAHRDFGSFSVAQRSAVQRALLSRRMRLAAVGTTAAGHSILLTHAGVTTRELALLGVGPEPVAIATALNQALDRALEGVSSAWQAGEPARLDLEPLHQMGTTGVEGGGLLYHRPSFEPLPGGPRRRFSPAELPDLLQACGHTQHRYLRKKSPSLPVFTPGALRTLTPGHYREGLHLPRDGEGALWMLDADMLRTAPEVFSLLALTGVWCPG